MATPWWATNGAAIPYLAQTYDSYGTVYASAGTVASSYGFTGEQVDDNELVYLRARYYQPRMGRFFQIDPSRQEVNPYRYSGDNPINRSDPSGLCQVAIFDIFNIWLGPNPCPWEPKPSEGVGQDLPDDPFPIWGEDELCAGCGGGEGVGEDLIGLSELPPGYDDLINPADEAQLREYEEAIQRAINQTDDDVIRGLLTCLQNDLRGVITETSTDYDTDPPHEVTFGGNAISKFRSHAEQMRRIARDELGIELGQKILRNPETQKQFEDFVRYVVQEGELRMGPWGIYRDALWSKLGSAIVIRQPNGEFVTFLEADKGNASRWDTLTEVNH